MHSRPKYKIQREKTKLPLLYQQHEDRPITYINCFSALPHLHPPICLFYFFPCTYFYCGEYSVFCFPRLLLFDPASTKALDRVFLSPRIPHSSPPYFKTNDKNTYYFAQVFSKSFSVLFSQPAILALHFAHPVPAVSERRREYNSPHYLTTPPPPFCCTHSLTHTLLSLFIYSRYLIPTPTALLSLPTHFLLSSFHTKRGSLSRKSLCVYCFYNALGEGRRHAMQGGGLRRHTE